MHCINVFIVLILFHGCVFVDLYFYGFVGINKGWFFVVGTNMLPNNADNWVLGISPESIGAVGALVNFTVAYLVSRVTAAPPAHIQELVESIRVPRGAGVAHAH